MTADRRNGGTAERAPGAGTAAVASSARSVGPPSRRSAVASAWANCATVLKRSAATGASAFRMAWSTLSGTLGRTLCTLGAGSVNRFARIAWVVAPVYGGSPASIS